MNSANNQNHGARRAEIEKLAAQLAQLLAAADAQERRALEGAFAAAVQQALGPVNSGADPRLQRLKAPPLTPELRAWLAQQHTDEEIVAWIQQLRDKGGVELAAFLPELEEIIGQP